MSHVLITGAARGIGLELCRLYAKRGDTVLAVCRGVSPELASLGVTVLEGVELTHQSDVINLAAALRGRSIDLAILNAGVLSVESFGDLEKEVSVFLVHPGYVQTDMTGGRGDSTPAESAERIARLLDRLGPSDSGTFWHANGTPLPW
ncbi:MAG: SDR family NAD(P)-dependent oxidoreductase [Ahniella sp.]|nr:SDR family NAD(P)-dependent oxidoreductase [Ahniella sp.]